MKSFSIGNILFIALCFAVSKEAYFHVLSQSGLHNMSSVTSPSTNACESLVDYACGGEEELPDGTFLEPLPMQVDDAIKEVLTENLASITSMLGSNERLRLMALAAFQSRVQCGASSPREICIEGLSQQILRAMQDPAEFKVDENINHENLQRFLADRDVRNIERRMISGFRSKLDLARREAELAEIFEQVKTIWLEKLNQYQMNPSDRQRLVARINAIQFRNNSCDETFSDLSGYKQIAFHEHETNVIVFCGRGAASSNSRAYFASVMAHEIGHALNPHELNSAAELRAINRAFGSTISCLRSNESVGASLQQMNETFADWGASEVMVSYIARHHTNISPTSVRNAYSNSLNMFCGGRERDNRISNTGRFSIYDANPMVRRQMGCQATHPQRRYCAPPSSRANSGLRGLGADAQRGIQSLPKKN